MEEIRQRQDVILFIDEIHEIVGAGNAGDGMDAREISSSLPLLVENFNWSEQHSTNTASSKRCCPRASYATS